MQGELVVYVMTQADNTAARQRGVGLPRALLIERGTVCRVSRCPTL